MDERENKKKLWIIGGSVVALLVVGTVTLVFIQDRSRREAERERDSAPLETHLSVPPNMIPPNANAANVPENVGIPHVVASVNTSHTADFRNFSLEARDNKFSPDTIIVRVNDVIFMKVAAVDKDYDFTQPDYGIREVIRRGESKVIAFAPSSEGKFIFYCEQCSDFPGKRPQGSIIVVSRSSP